MAVQMRSESRGLVPEADSHILEDDHLWPSTHPAAGPVRLPLDGVNVTTWTPDSDTYADVTQAFADAASSWERATLLFTRSVRAFHAAHRRRVHRTSQPASTPAPSTPPEAAHILASPILQPTTTDPAERPELSRLTRRQREVAALIARGYSDAQIAQELVLTPGTASNHVAHILRRLDCRSRAQVATWAARNGLLAASGT